MDNPQPIETAPTDGTVILTDDGFVRTLGRISFRNGVVINDYNWVACSPDGTLYSCADEGYFYCSPIKWVKLPDWI